MDIRSAYASLKSLVVLLLAGVVIGLSPIVSQAQDLFDVNVDEIDDNGQLVEVAAMLSHETVLPGKTYLAAVILDIAAEWHINSAQPYQDWLIPVQVVVGPAAGLSVSDAVYPPGTDAAFVGDPISVYDGRVLIFFEVTIDDDLAYGDYFLPIEVTYQSCNDKECRPPVTDELELAVAVGDTEQPRDTNIFIGVDLAAMSAPPNSETPTEQSDLQRLIDEYGVWGYFLALGLAFITGLLLSFSPCTYPMIPITVSVFAGQQRSIGRGFILSLFYVGSMAIVYGIMGLIVSLVGGVFGAWLASPPVVIGIAIVFVIFALSMFGLYELNVPSSLRQKLGAAKSGGGVLGSIILGIVAALVVSPCVGPFVAGILLYIATYGSPAIGFLVLFVFALGLGTFFLIIGTFSSAISALPKAGEWMESVKKFFGFVLLLMALYFLRTIVATSLTAILTGLVLMALGIFGGGLDRLTSEAPFFARVKKFVGIIALLFGVYFLMGTVIVEGMLLPPASEWLPAASSSPAAEKSGIRWETDLESALARARAEGKPVLIDTWATWCANCRVLEKKTFGDMRVIAEAKRFISLKIQMEKAGTPETSAFMERFGWKSYSLPTTLILDASGATRATLRGVVTPEELLAEMRAVH